MTTLVGRGGEACSGGGSGGCIGGSLGGATQHSGSPSLQNCDPDSSRIIPQHAQIQGLSQSIDRSLARSICRLPGAADDKYSRGVALIASGSETYSGAGLLVTAGAMATGVGMVRFVSTPRPTSLVLAQLPECVPAAGRFQAATIGSGWDSDRLLAANELAGLAAKAKVPLIVDAGALPFVESWRTESWGSTLENRLILTPHLREAANLLHVPVAEVQTQQEAAALALAARGCVVALKAATTVVATPYGRVFTYRAPSHWGGVAGAGDVLAGIITGIVAWRQADLENGGVDYDLGEVVAGAVWIHGQAADLAAQKAATRNVGEYVAGESSGMEDRSPTAPQLSTADMPQGESLSAANRASVAVPRGPIRASQIARAVPAVIAALLV